MNRNFVFMILAVLLVSMFAFSANVQRVSAIGTIYIRSDGSIDPPTTLIVPDLPSTYRLTGNIYDFDGFVIERDEITLNGAGYAIEGGGNGFLLIGRRYITIINMTIRHFTTGFFINSSSFITLSGNNITNNDVGIGIYSSNNLTISENSINNNKYGVNFVYSNISFVRENRISNNDNSGIWLLNSFSNSFWRNNITNTPIGVSLDNSSSNNWFVHNRFIDNTEQVRCETPFHENIWNDSYPSGGNHWSDYSGEDSFSGPQQNREGSDGIGDTPYVINTENQDYYPLLDGAEESREVPFWEQGWLWVIVIVVLAALIAVGTYFLKMRRSR